MRAVPTRVGSESDWSVVHASQVNASCGIRDGELYCWGNHFDFQLGVDTTVAYEDTPLRIGTDTGWTAITAGGHHTCGLRSGNLYCWGANVHGQLGTGTSAHATPVTVEFPPP